MKVGDLVQSKRYKILGIVIEDQMMIGFEGSVCVLWLDKNTKTIEPKNGVIKLHKNT